MSVPDYNGSTRMLKVFLLAVYVSVALSADHIWMNVFNSIDTNQDKNISQAEFDVAVVNVDANGDGKVPEAEWLAGWRQATAGNHHQGATDKAGHLIFSRTDTNKDGSLSIAELKGMFSQFDLNSDANSSMDEFSKVWSSIHSHEAGHPHGTTN
ncbi:hypothetical protein SNE40_022313 [Patella caerulea]|uniref:EF-hand domain-containing protein n=1 Tax=Patella caerulea TaxID=87958 RepID=A0AAN8GFI9_PATCE